MNIQSKIKASITNIRKFLESCGAEFSNNSDGSNSVYLYTGTSKIRISDHMSPAFGTEDLNIVLSANNPLQYVVGINSSVLVYSTFKDLRMFLKSWCEIANCRKIENDGKFNSIASKKQKKLDELNNAIQQKNNTLGRLTSKVDAESRKLDRFLSSSELIDLIYDSSDKRITFSESLKLTDKQKANIGELILKYAVQNNGGTKKKK